MDISKLFDDSSSIWRFQLLLYYCLSSTESPAGLPPAFKLSSSASLDSGVGSSISSKTLLQCNST